MKFFEDINHLAITKVMELISSIFVCDRIEEALVPEWMLSLRMVHSNLDQVLEDSNCNKEVLYRVYEKLKEAPFLLQEMVIPLPPGKSPQSVCSPLQVLTQKSFHHVWQPCTSEDMQKVVVLKQGTDETGNTLFDVCP